jgi:hypothetical protein
MVAMISIDVGDGQQTGVVNGIGAVCYQKILVFVLQMEKS